MTFEQLSLAVDLCLRQPSVEWGLILRFAMLWACSSARRNSDMRSLTWRSMCLHDNRLAQDEHPLGKLSERTPTTARCHQFAPPSSQHA